MIALIWIDWYAYHHARLRALAEHPRLDGRVTGIELVGRTGVHKGLVFRETAEPSLPLHTLMPSSDWSVQAQAKAAVLLWKKLSEINPETVLVPGYYTLPGFAAALWAKAHGRHSVLMTESTQHDHERTPWKEALKGRVMRLLFDSAIAGGQAHVRYLHALGFPRHRIARCYDVVDNDFFANAAAELRSSESGAGDSQPPYFLYVGRLSPEKNIRGLLDEYAAYRQAGGSWTLKIVGGGPQEQELRQRAQSSGWGESIFFEGLKSSRELPAYYSFAGAFVLPSTREPWGLVVNEAMASGLPVLVSDRCGCAEDLVKDHRNGFVFDPALSGALAERMSAIGDLPAEARRRFGRESQAIIANFSPRKWAGEVCQLDSAGRNNSVQIHAEAAP